MSLFYLSSGVILSGENGGFSTHASTMNDVFLLSKEWSVKHLTVSDKEQFSLESARNENVDMGMKTYNLIEKLASSDHDGVLETFKKHKKTLKQEFAPTIKKSYIDGKTYENGE